MKWLPANVLNLLAARFGPAGLYRFRSDYDDDNVVDRLQSIFLPAAVLSRLYRCRD